MFYIVELKVVDKDGKIELLVAVVPPYWFNSDSQVCFWPVSRDVQKLVKEGQQPGENWKSYPARILCATGTYEEAHNLLPKAEEDSDFGDAGGLEILPKKRVANTPLRYLSSPSPPPPKRAKRCDIPKPPALENVNHVDVRVLHEPQNSIISIPLPPENNSESNLNDDESTDMTALDPPGITTHITDGMTEVQGFPPNFVLVSVDDRNNFLENSSGGQFAKITEKLYTLIGLFQGLKEKINNMDNKIDRICNQNLINPRPSIPKMLIRKFSTIEELTEFESSIKNKPENATLLINELRQYGGDSSSDCVNQILKVIFTNELARTFSLYGLKNNRNFSRATLTPLILEAVRSHSAQTQRTRILSILLENGFVMQETELNKRKKLNRSHQRPMPVTAIHSGNL